MKLYYNPYACSLAPAIAAAEGGLALDLIYVDIFAEPHVLADGSPYSAINPRNYVPLLELDNGDRLSEVAAIVQYIADRAGNGIAPPQGTPERYRLQEWLTFIGTELHKFYSPWLFHPEVGETAQAYARDKIASRYRLIDLHLSENEYLLGEAFSVADAYLFVMVNWAGVAKTPLEEFPHIRAWSARMKKRPAVIEAVAAHTAKPKVAAA